MTATDVLEGSRDRSFVTLGNRWARGVVGARLLSNCAGLTDGRAGQADDDRGSTGWVASGSGIASRGGLPGGSGLTCRG
jgi:hypothetical protein